MGFMEDLQSLLNKYSMENGSDTPDFMLAEHLSRCLDNWNLTVTARERWYGRITPAILQPIYSSMTIHDEDNTCKHTDVTVDRGTTFCLQCNEVINIGDDE